MSTWYNDIELIQIIVLTKPFMQTYFGKPKRLMTHANSVFTYTNNVCH